MDIWIRSSRARSLLTSAIEVFNRETDGVFTAKPVLRKIRGKKKTVLYVENAYPLQTDTRMPSQVYHGNMSAFRRVAYSLISAKIDFFGGYHSHPQPYKGIRLSKSDIDFIKDQLKFLKKREELNAQDIWIELLVSIKRRGYVRKQKTGWKKKHYRKRVHFHITITPYTAFDIILSAYTIDFSGKNPVIKEEKIHVPKG